MKKSNCISSVGLIIAWAMTTLALNLAPNSSYAQGHSAQPRLGPASLITIEPDLDLSDTINRADLSEVLGTIKKPNEALSDDIRFNMLKWATGHRYCRDIWCLQFSFKPLRVVQVDIPNREGFYDKKNVWYLVYRVKNLGPAKITHKEVPRPQVGEEDEKVINEYRIEGPASSMGAELVDEQLTMPIVKDTQYTSEETRAVVRQTRDTALILRNQEGTYKPTSGQVQSIDFAPQFIIATEKLVLDTEAKNNEQTGRYMSERKQATVQYVDQIIPIAMGSIMRREGMTIQPETTVSITTKSLATNEEVWGVAMWTDIDPRINYFSLYVSGLTNAYCWIDSEDPDGTLGKDRKIISKMLKTNWWRKGDRFTLDETQIQYGQPGEDDSEWGGLFQNKWYNWTELKNMLNPEPEEKPAQPKAKSRIPNLDEDEEETDEDEDEEELDEEE